MANKDEPGIRTDEGKEGNQKTDDRKPDKGTDPKTNDKTGREESPEDDNTPSIYDRMVLEEKSEMVRSNHPRATRKYVNAVVDYDEAETRPQLAEHWNFQDPEFNRFGKIK